MAGQEGIADLFASLHSAIHGLPTILKKITPAELIFPIVCGKSLKTFQLFQCRESEKLMLPLKVLKDSPKVEVEIKSKSCNMCQNILTPSTTFVQITDDLETACLCSNCVNSKTGKKVIFKDSLENYEKRKKTGAINQLFKEFKL